MKLMPAASARSIMACDVAASAAMLCIIEPAVGSPNVMAPRHSVETFTPLCPSVRYSMLSLPASGTAWRSNVARDDRSRPADLPGRCASAVGARASAPAERHPDAARSAGRLGGGAPSAAGHAGGHLL